MQTIGIIGGMSWESSLEYYRVMNEMVKERLGGLHSARILLSSVDFDDIRQRMLADDWHGAGVRLADEARRLEAAGAACIIIGTNTMHMVAPQVEAAVDVPVLHIADATAEVIKARGMSRVGLLGTVFTMEHPFYRDRLAGFGIETIIPAARDRQIVDRVIFDELCKGRYDDGSRREYLRIIDDLTGQGAEAVIFGCTEIGLLVPTQSTDVPVLDTCRIHAAAAVEFALSDQ